MAAVNETLIYLDGTTIMSLHYTEYGGLHPLKLQVNSVEYTQKLQLYLNLYPLILNSPKEHFIASYLPAVWNHTEEKTITNWI